VARHAVEPWPGITWKVGPTWRGIRRAFPDGNSVLMLVAARLRHIATTKWGKRRYLAMERLLNPAKQDQEAAA
jgi:hypothetical protein